MRHGRVWAPCDISAAKTKEGGNAMKNVLLIGLIVELIVGGLLLVGMSTASAQAEADDSGQIQLIPDIGKIYRAALISPLREVEDEIQDEEIAGFYHRLLQKYDLDEP